MEYAEGAGLILLGLLIIVFGSTPASRVDAKAPAAPRFRPPAWFDQLIKWAIGILCIWFGASLLLGTPFLLNDRGRQSPKRLNLLTGLLVRVFLHMLLG